MEGVWCCKFDVVEQQSSYIKDQVITNWKQDQQQRLRVITNWKQNQLLFVLKIGPVWKKYKNNDEYLKHVYTVVSSTNQILPNQ